MKKSYTTKYNWSKEETYLLSILWFYNKPADVYKKLSHIPLNVIKYKASKEKMIRHPYVIYSIKEEIINRNKTLGSGITHESALQTASTCSSLNELTQNHPKTYHYLRRHNLLESAKKGFLYKRFNYIENFLAEVVRRVLKTEVIVNDRKTIKPLELDLYVPSLNIAFEYDGIRFHSSKEAKEKENHKNQVCKDKGISLYRIKEKDKSKSSENNILDTLNSFGFDASGINILEVKKVVFESQWDSGTVRDTVSKYSSLIEVWTHEPRLYDLVTRLGLQEEYFSGLKRNIRNCFRSDKEIAKIFKEEHNAKDIRTKHPKDFNAVSRNKDKFPLSWEIYQSKYSNRGYSSTKSEESLMVT